MSLSITGVEVKKSKLGYLGELLIIFAAVSARFFLGFDIFIIGTISGALAGGITAYRQLILTNSFVKTTANFVYEATKIGLTVLSILLCILYKDSYADLLYIILSTCLCCIILYKLKPPN